MLKNISRKRKFALMAAAAGAALQAEHAFATTYTWNGAGANNNWTTAANWGGSAPTAVNTDDLHFAGSTRLAPAVDTNNPWTLNALTFDSGAGAFTISGNQLKFDGTNAKIVQNATNNQIISSNLLLNTNTTFSAGGSGIVSLSGVITGTGNATFDSGSWRVNNSSGSYAGTVTISSATVQMDHPATGNYDPLGTGNLVLQNAKIISNGATGNGPDPRISYGATTVEGGNIFSLSNAGGGNSTTEITLDSIARASGTKGTLIINDTAGAFGVSTGTNQHVDLFVTSAPSNVNGMTNPYYVHVTGAGTTASHVSYSGSVGFLNATYVAMPATGAGTELVTVSADAALTANRDIYALQTSANLTNSGGTRTVTIRGGGLIFNAAKQIAPNVIFGTSGTPAEGDVFVASGSTASLAGTVTATDLVKFGDGTLQLSGANSITGSTTVNNGTLQANSTTSLSSTAKVDLYPNTVLSVGANQTIGGLNSPLGTSSSVALSSNTLTIGNASTNLNSSFAGVIDGTNGNLTKAGSGTLRLVGANTYTGTTTINSGTLLLASTGSIDSSTTINLNGGSLNTAAKTNYVALATQKLMGQGSFAGATSANSIAGTLSIGQTHANSVSGVVSSLTMSGNVSLLGSSEFDLYTATTADKLSVTGSLNYGSSTLKVAKSGTFTFASGQSWDLFDSTSASSNFGNTFGMSDANLPSLTGTGLTWAFNSVSGVLSLAVAPTTTTTYNLSAGSSAASIIKGGSTSITGVISNVGTGTADTLSFTGLTASASGVGSVSGTATNGGPLANAGGSATNSGNLTFTSSTVGTATIAGVITTAKNATLGTNATAGTSTTTTVTVLDHASGSLGGTLSLPSVIVGYGVAQTATITETNAAGSRVNLKTTHTGDGSSLSLSDISAVTAGGSASLTGTLATGKGVGAYSQTFTVTDADDSTLSGASSNVGTHSVTFTGTVFDHASGSLASSTLSLPNVIVGYGSAQTATVGVTNAAGTRVNLKSTNNGAFGQLSLSNASAVTAGGSASLTGTLATGQGVGAFSQAFNVTFGDDSALLGNNAAVSTQSLTFTGTVFDHASGSLASSTLALPSVIVGYGSAQTATVGLTNAAGTRVNLKTTNNGAFGQLSLSNASAVTAGGSTSLTGTLATGKGVGAFSQAFNVTYGDDSALLGNNAAVSTQSLTFTGTVFDHASGSLASTTLSLPNVIVGYGSAQTATVGVTNAAGTRVNLKSTNNGAFGQLSLSNAAAVAAGGSASLTGTLATGKGVGAFSQAFNVTFGDDSALSGNNAAVSTQSLTFTGTVFDHASGSLASSTLSLPSVIVGYGSAQTATVGVTNAAGTRVNLKTTNDGAFGQLSLSNASALAAGGSASLTGTLATGKGVGAFSQAFNVTYGDDSALAGNNAAVSTQSLTFTGTVFDHASGSLASSTLALPSVIVGYGAAQTATVGVNNAAGTRVNLKTTNNGAFGALSLSNASAVAAGGSTNLTGTLATGQGVGAFSQTFNVTYGDDSALAGNNAAVSSQSLTFTGTVFDHASGSLASGTLALPNVIVGYGSAQTATVGVNNAAGTRVNLKTTNNGAFGALSLSNASAVAAGGSTNLTGTLATGQGVGAISQVFNVTYGDDSALSGNNAAVSSQSLTFTGTVFDHSSGSLASGTLALPSVIVGYGSAQTATVGVNNAAGSRVNLKTTNNGAFGQLSLSNASAVAAGGSTNLTGTLGTGQGVGAFSQVFNVTYADDSALAGASNNTGSQSLTFTGTVYDHSSGSLGGTALAMPDVIVGYGSAQTANLAINNASGTRVNLKSTHTGDGSNLSLSNASAVAAGGSANLTGTLATGKGVGAYSQNFNVTYQDDSALAGASTNTGSSTVSLTGTVYDHSSGSLASGTLALPSVIVGYGSAQTATVGVNNAAGTRVALKSTNNGAFGQLSLSNAAGVAAGGSTNLTGTLGTGKGIGAFSQVFNVTYADDSALAGASSNTGTQNLTFTGTVYDHSNASLDSGANQTTQTITYNALKGGSVADQSFSIYNRNVNGPTADLKLTGFGASGSGAISTSLAAVSGLTAGGAGSSYTTSLNTSTAGNFSKTITMAANQLVDDSAMAGNGNNNNGTLTVNIVANVGYATADNSNNRNQFGTALTGSITNSTSYNGLESQVAGESGSGGGADRKNSIATIVAGKNATGGTEQISMSWRLRTQDPMPTEVYPGSTPPFPTTPAGLTSDVLRLTGMDADTGPDGKTDAFALQMTYDGVGNEADSATGGLIFLAWLNPGDDGVGDGTNAASNNDRWVNAIDGNFGIGSAVQLNPSAYTNVQDSWANFASSHLIDNDNIANYVGAWGVDINSSYGGHEGVVWAVLNHNSDYSVVPEPGSLAIIGFAAGAGLLGRGRRRRRSESI